MVLSEVPRSRYAGPCWEGGGDQHLCTEAARLEGRLASSGNSCEFLVDLRPGRLAATYRYISCKHRDGLKSSWKRWPCRPWRTSGKPWRKGLSFGVIGPTVRIRWDLWILRFGTLPYKNTGTFLLKGQVVGFDSDSMTKIQVSYIQFFFWGGIVLANWISNSGADDVQALLDDHIIKTQVVSAQTDHLNAFYGGWVPFQSQGFELLPATGCERIALRQANREGSEGSDVRLSVNGSS